MHDAVNMDASAPTRASAILSATIVIATKAFGAPGRLRFGTHATILPAATTMLSVLGPHKKEVPKPNLWIFNSRTSTTRSQGYTVYALFEAGVRGLGPQCAAAVTRSLSS